MSFRRFRLVAGVTPAVLGLVAASSAFGHAVVEGTSPAAGSSTRHIRVVSVRFGEPVQSGTIAVLRGGARVHAARSGLDPHNAARLRARFSHRLKPGHYSARWNIVADDGDPQHGHFGFRVRR